MVGTKKAKETEKKAMMKMKMKKKKAASKSHGSRPTVLLAFCGVSLAHSQPQRPTLHRTRCRNTGEPAREPCGEGFVEDHDRPPAFRFNTVLKMMSRLRCCVLCAVCYIDAVATDMKLRSTEVL